ncbi:aminoglycoside phosphotransferase family protein [Streptomyces sp. bgisy091]|uniref:aminoglycoside phosphotransferase family protein n=1 Tax=Streptomyces sp. bgisy091 TaxID=3413778 RepID=UPI003D7659C0
MNTTSAPRLVAAEPSLRTVIITAVPGRRLHGTALPPDQERQTFGQIGALSHRIHESRPARPAPAGSGPAVAKAERHLSGARSHLLTGDADFVPQLVRHPAALPPLEWVETHGDFQLRNILCSPTETNSSDAFAGVIDLERSEPDPAVRDLVRLSDAWADRPDLRDAFLAEYGRSLLPAEHARLVIDAALDAVSGISYGLSYGDPELVGRGQRTLAQLRAEHSAPFAPADDAT